MEKRQAMVIGGLCGVAAAVLTAWWLVQWLGFGFWFLVLVVPACLGTMQAVASGVAGILSGVNRRTP